MSDFEIREFTLPGSANEEWAAYCRMNTDDSVEALGPQGPRNSPEADLKAAHAVLPQAPAVHTFNAAENHHMLAVNETLGFRRAAALGMFQAVRKPVESAAQSGQT